MAAQDLYPGYGAPYYKAFYNGVEIQDRIESMSYTSSEDDDDNAEFNVRLENVKDVDKPQYQEGAEWSILWGYIGGKISHTRKVWCYETKWEFQVNNILLTISFHEKGISMKQRDTKNVYTNTNMVDILHNTGKIHGLKTAVEIKDAAGNPLKVFTTDELQANLKQFAANYAAKQALDTKLFGSTDQELESQVEASGSTSFSDQLAFRQIQENFAMYGNVAQGNKTDKQLLDELGKRQPGGQYIVDTTDDEATLKQRNFNQKPIRSYKYGADGELISFCPETKGTSKDGTSVNMLYDGWDGNNKTYFAGDVNTLSDEAKATLAKFKKKAADLSTKVQTTVLYNAAITHEAGLASDATNRVQIIPTPVTIADKLAAINKTIQYFEPTTNNKAFGDPNGNADDVINHATNARDEAELKMNPGTLDAWGDPTVMKGKIITVLGVGKKYSGNYYITKVVHDFASDKAYIMKLSLVRQGHNIQTNSSYIPYTQEGDTLNKTVGQPGGTLKTKIPSITSNPNQ